MSAQSLTPPDSWEKLEEDLDRCIKGSSLCVYYSASGSCYDCTISDDNSEVCDSRALRDIKDRIRKLRGEDIDREFGRVPTCGDCCHLLEGCCDYGICGLEFEEAFTGGDAHGNRSSD